MYATLGEITQRFIKATLLKTDTSVLALIMFMIQDQIILGKLSEF